MVIIRDSASAGVGCNNRARPRTTPYNAIRRHCRWRCRTKGPRAILHRTGETRRSPFVQTFRRLKRCPGCTPSRAGSVRSLRTRTSRRETTHERRSYPPLAGPRLLRLLLTIPPSALPTRLPVTEIRGPQRTKSFRIRPPSGPEADTNSGRTLVTRCTLLFRFVTRSSRAPVLMNYFTVYGLRCRIIIFNAVRYENATRR